MIDAFRGYVRTKNKKPCQRFGSGEKLLTIEEASEYSEYAGILNGSYTIKDVDELDEAQRLYRLVCDQDLNCRVYKTTRGMQFMFQNSEYAPRGIVKATDALGFTFDVRAGTNMYTILKFDGKVREVLREFDESKPLTPYPKYFSQVRGAAKFTGMSNGDGRNGALFRHVGILVRNGFTAEEIKEVMPLINNYAFDAALSGEELQKICRNEAIENFMAFSASNDFVIGLKPAAFTDVAMAEVFAKECGKTARYCPATGWLSWQGTHWEASELKVQQQYIGLAKRMLDDAKKEVNAAFAQAAMAVTGEASEEAKAKKAQKSAETYFKFASKMNEHSKVSGILKLAKSLLEIDLNVLDADAFLLNTPKGLIDLKTGEVHPHDSEKYCCKITKCSPSAQNSKLWLDCLKEVTCDDEEYMTFLQTLAGAMAIGKVYHEALVIAHGSGANGKSTVFNTIASVLGDYSGKIPAESLTTRAKNVKADLAELRGKRFILAGETEEGQRLSTSMLKQLASTDDITAERKYHDPFSFSPTHTTVLYTNHLPKIGSIDAGTWRRVFVAPFNAIIKNPKTDFAEQLLDKAGGAVLDWIIEGARLFINSGFKLPECKAVTEANEKYKQESNWLAAFLDECCTVGDGETCAGGLLYKAYRAWAADNGEYIRRNRDFAEALRVAGFESSHTKRGAVWTGVSLCVDRVSGNSAAEDFLN